MDRLEVEDVEPSHDGPVEQDRPNSLERTESADETQHPAGPVRPVHANLRRADRLEAFGQRHHHGRERREPVGPVEGAIIDADELGMRFAERPPQR